MYSTSGEYAAWKPHGIGNWAGIPPVSGTVKSWLCRLLYTFRGDENRMLLPSGVKPRTTSGLGCVVSRVGEPPPSGMVNTSVFPSYWALKAIVWPSGEKTG